MTASSMSSSPRVCPSCGARNSSVSLFCAECGASLNGGDGDTASYSPYAPGADDTQATVAFKPGASEDDSPAGSTRLAKPVTSTVTPPSWQEDPAPAHPGATVWEPREVVFQPATSSPRGMRGFFLGVLGIILILLVFGAWIWAGVLDDSTRTSISDFFSFLDFRN